MCGIVGYIGKQSAIQPVLTGLKSLEYRGYDSAGISGLDNGKPFLVREVGQVDNLIKKVERKSIRDPSLVIGHTRWATHGAPTEKNAHPHSNQSKTIFVVHNGIIENSESLKQKLVLKGYKFISDTDSEVIPHLIDSHLQNETGFFKAFKKAVGELEGAYGIAAFYANSPDKIYAAKLSSPLVIGINKDENLVASDPSSIAGYSKKFIFLDDYEVAELTADSYMIENIHRATKIHRQAEELDYDSQKADLAGFSDFMIKEINEAPQTVLSASRGRLSPSTNRIKLGGLELVSEQLNYIDRLVIVACGTSYYAGLVGEYLIEEIAGIPVEVELASEFKYKNEPFSRSTALLAISQSGETADTIAALKKVENYGVLRLGIVNTAGSTIARMTDAGVYCHAGPEQSVASTKAFIAQVTVLTEIALHLSRGNSSLYKPLMKNLAAMPNLLKKVLENTSDIKKLAQKYCRAQNFLYIGRGYGYPCALEGALKLKEISYIHAEGYAAGEMKHGPLAMVDKSFPTLAIATKSRLQDKTLSSIEEIRSRGGPVIAIATVGDKKISNLTKDVIFVPDVMEQLQPMVIATVLQLFAYYVASSKKLNIDRPRNLAKAVTVE